MFVLKMEFINKGPNQKVRQGKPGKYLWKTVKTGETIELPEEIGKDYGFEPVASEERKATEGKVSDKKVETKQFEESKKKENLVESLQKFKRIGKKTAEDIANVYPSEEELVEAISNNEELPFRDDIADLLKKEYGNKK